MGRISVIIPTFNRSAFLLESIAAIRNQTRPVDEIIVVDDGSTDDTHERVAALGHAIQYVYQPNNGKAAALNNGLGRCTGDYVWICDDDDIALPQAAELLSHALDVQASVAFSFGRFQRFTVETVSGKRLLSDPVYWPDLNTASLLVSLLLDCFIFHNACLIRKRALDKVGPFRSELLRSQDYEMTIRLTRQFDAAYVPAVVFLQRAHSGMRGSKADRFSPEQQVQKWLHYDGIFFRELYGTIPLSRFAPKRLAGAESEILERACLLQRACVFWRRKLFDLSLVDLAAAAGKGRGELTATEEAICGDFIHAKFGCSELATQPQLANWLRGFAEGGMVGQSMAKAITAPLPWFIRDFLIHKKWRQALALLRLLINIHGFKGAACLLRRSIGKRWRTAQSASRHWIARTIGDWPRSG